MFRLRSAVANTLLICLALLLPVAVAAQGPTGDVIISTNTSWPTANYNVTSLTVQSGAALAIGGGSSVTVANGITVSGNSSIVLQATNTTAQVNGTWQGAGVTLQAGSVQVDAGSSINADAQGYVSDAGPGATSGEGGSYGGAGGGGYAASLYGAAAMPVDLGSGGSRAQYVGSNGGGAIRLIVSGTLTNNGTISANGEQVEPSRGAGGSGGSVYVTTGTLSGVGTFTANGGANTTPSLSGSPAGGGGRVAIYYVSAANFTGFASSTATGGVFTGTATGNGGANGSAAFFDTSAPNSNVTVYQGYDFPANSSTQFNSLTVGNGASVTVGGGAQIAVTQALTISGTITAQSINNQGQINKEYLGKGVTIAAGSLTVTSSGSINADGAGYAGDAGPGAGFYTAGGSYGGTGGGQGPSTVYGSATAPVDLGSGGGGVSGGGAIELLVGGTFSNNGVISANGGSISNSGTGAGSGGSVYVQAQTIQGTGTITANGGSNTLPNSIGGGGGGGRIAGNYVIYAGLIDRKS